jgi:hypothetical protein
LDDSRTRMPGGGPTAAEDATLDMTLVAFDRGRRSTA